MKTHLLFPLFAIFCLLSQTIIAQNTDKSWAVERQKINSFIENRGQFQQRDLSQPASKIYFAFDGNQEDFYFTNKGVVIELTHQEKRKKSDEEKAARKAKKLQGFADGEEFRAFEEVGHTLKIEKDDLFLNWLGANPKVQIIAQEKDDFYHSYSYYNEKDECVNENHLASFRTITYKNLYPNIDVLYEIHPERGFKYSVIVHPGGDISQVKLEYSKDALLNVNGSISTNTKFGDMIDHAPLTFYNNNRSAVIKSKYNLNNNVISFELGDYDKTKTIVIDPWTQTPNFPSSNWDCVWECERDGAGNVYIIGGTSPLQLIKYNQAGALQWTYNTPYDTTEWLGTFATDLLGNSYVANGSPSKIFKVNTAAGLLWNNTNPGGLFSLTEFWNITFNCDQTKLVIAGTGGTAFGGPQPYIYDINMSNGNVLTSVKVHSGTLFNAQEVRSITPCNNGKYYFLTHDSIGWIHQNLTGCTPSSQTYRVTSNLDLGYKCENWRYNNSGIMALAQYNNTVFLHKGNELQKRGFYTAGLLGTVAIPAGSFITSFGNNQVGCSGIDIDDCGNIYVGSTNGVYKFDQNLVQTGFFPTTFTVYDVEVNTAGDIIAGGSTGTSSSGTRTGTIQSFAAGACASQATVCCDATICNQPTLCLTSPLTPLIVATSGGTFSATCGACINATTGVFNPALAGIGNHTITYTLACGFESIVITVTPCATLSVCQEANGSLTVSNGVGPYNWSQWSPGSSTPITNSATCTACGYTWAGFTCLNGFTPVTSCVTPAGWVPIGTGTNIGAPSAYPVQVVDNGGTVFNISGPGVVPLCSSCPTVTLTPSAQNNVLCNGAATGSFSIVGSGGTGPYDYILIRGGSAIDSFINVTGTQTFSGLIAGTYTINTIDGNNCTGTTNVIISQPTPLVIAIDSTKNATCGLNNGGAFISVSGGFPAYTYLWSNNATTQDITGLAATTYQVTVTDANGCTLVSNSIVINNLAGINLVVDTVRNVLCNGGATGYINTTASAGTPAYTYLWSNNATTQDISGLVVGTYRVTITDSQGCTATSSLLNITQPTVLNMVVDSTNGTSCIANNGRIFITVTGGQSAYTYLWSNSATTQDITGLTASTYQVTVTDANGCTLVSNPIVINSASGLNLAIDTIQNVACNGGATGYINITASSGTPAYTYLWSNNATTGDLSGLTAGTYQLTVTDVMGCSITSAMLNISAPTSIIITIDSLVHASCGATNGQAFITVTGGTPNYTYLWSTSATTQNITGLAANTYQVTVTDANACTMVSSNVVINAIGSVGLTIDTVQNVACNGGATGYINISTVGGTPAFSYLWSNNATTQDISGLAIGTYQVTITDGLGCTTTSSSITITEPTVLNVVVDSTNGSSCVANDGRIFITVTDGTPTYTYLWSNNATTQDITGLAASTYQVTVTDANGCTLLSNPIVVGSASGLNLVVDTVQNVACAGGSNAYINITASSGTPSYTYLWSNNATTGDISGLTAGTYQVTLTDAMGCSITSSMITVTQPSMMAMVDTARNTNCGFDNGTISIGITGGTASYTFLWSNNATTQNLTGLAATTYQVTITDANACTMVSNSIIVNANPMLVLTIDTVQNVACNGTATGYINTSTSGGTMPYTYLWSNNGTTASISGLAAGIYQLTITDTTACVITSNIITITEPSLINLTVDSTTNIDCGASNGSISTTASGGTANYTYLWSNGQTTADITGLSTAGLYEFTVTDGNGCMASSTATIGNNAGMTSSVVATAVSCNGGTNGGLTLTVQGGTPNYVYLWSNNATTAAISGLGAGSYFVTVTDNFGCTLLWDTTLATPSPLVVSVANNTVSCFGMADGQLNSIVTGGTPSYTYLWSTAATTASASGLAVGSYSLQVTDNNGCTASASSSIGNATAMNLVITALTDTLDCNQNPIGVIAATATGGTGNITYLWSNASTNATATGLSSGTFGVTATDDNGCTISGADTIYTLVVPTLNPDINNTGLQNVEVTVGDTINLNAGANQIGVSYTWSASSANFVFFNANAPTTTALPNASAVYSLTITATSTDGCVVSDTLLVAVQGLFNGMPNAFSPNDDTYNDKFGPVGLITSDIIEFKVFNRWGELIYDNKNIDFGGWDGLYMGVEQPSDVYIYLLRYKLLGQTEQVLKGEFTLIR